LSGENSDKTDHSAQEPEKKGVRYVCYPREGEYEWPGRDGDEIDLADLAGVLFRRRWFILGCALILALAAYGYTFLLPAKYTGNTMIEIGQLYTEAGYKRVEAPEETKNRIESLAAAIHGRIENHLSEKSGIQGNVEFSLEEDLRIDAPQNANIVSVELETIKSPKLLEFLSRINRALLRDHNRIFDQEKNRITTSIERIKIKNQNIDVAIQTMTNQIEQVKREYDEKMEEKENGIARIQNTMGDLKAQKTYMRGRIQLLEDEREAVQKRVEAAEKRYRELLDYKLSANKQAQGTGAVALMLFTSEIQHVRDYLDQLRERWLFEIPEEINSLEAEIKSTDSEIRNLEADMALEKKRLGRLKPELKDRIEEIEADIAEQESKKKENLLEISSQESRLKNMITTQVLVAPKFSETRTLPSVKLPVALGLVLGLFLGVFGAFLLEFWRNNRERIVNG
jgi:capsular polysaccharide biosynthesis protein